MINLINLNLVKSIKTRQSCLWWNSYTHQFLRHYNR